MAYTPGDTRIRLSGEQRRDMRDALMRFFSEELDESLSEFRADQLLEFMVGKLGAPIYNQAVQDARGFMQERLSDLEAVLFERQ